MREASASAASKAPAASSGYVAKQGQLASAKLAGSSYGPGLVVILFGYTRRLAERASAIAFSGARLVASTLGSTVVKEATSAGARGLRPLKPRAWPAASGSLLACAALAHAAHPRHAVSERDRRSMKTCSWPTAPAPLTPMPRPAPLSPSSLQDLCRRSSSLCSS